MKKLEHGNREPLQNSVDLLSNMAINKFRTTEITYSY